MTRPNFLIIGTQKAGTRWMLNMLVQHPDVFMPSYEVHYFDRPENFAKGAAWYESHFAGARGERAIGEKTPSYLMRQKKDPLARVRRIHELLPDARLIAILRNPVERAVSSINHQIRVGDLPADVDLDAAVGSAIAEKKAIIRYGYYYQHLTAFREFFPPSQMLVLIYEDDVVAQPLATLARVCSFLGVDPAFRFAGVEKQVNVSRTSRIGLKLVRLLPMDSRRNARVVAWLEQKLGIRGQKKRPSSRALDRLYEVYAPENAKLFELLGREVRSWAKSNAYIVR